MSPLVVSGRAAEDLRMSFFKPSCGFIKAQTKIEQHFSHIYICIVKNHSIYSELNFLIQLLTLSYLIKVRTT